MTEESAEDITTRIVRFENGEMDDVETVKLFQDMADSGLVWELQGRYQRILKELVESGLVNLKKPFDELNVEAWKKRSGC